MYIVVVILLVGQKEVVFCGDSVPLSLSLVLVHISRAIADLSLDLWRGEPVAKLCILHGPV